MVRALFLWTTHREATYLVSFSVPLDIVVHSQFESYLFVQRDATQSAVLLWKVAGAPARGGQGGQAPTLEKIEWAMPTLEILTVV